MSQIKFLKKNKLDISNANITLTASEGQLYVDYIRNRSNDSAWITTGSTDAALTNIIVDFGESRDLDSIVLIKHNFKAYTVQYWNGSTYVDFSTPINTSGNSTATTSHSFTLVSTSKIKLIVSATMVLNADKYLYQLIATTLIGQFTGYPIIGNAEINRGRVGKDMLSGKKSQVENVGGFSCQLVVPYWNIPADIAIVESLYDANEGFLTWLGGGDAAQFTPISAQGYRLEDMFLMKCANEYSPDYAKGVYLNGLDLKIKLVEVVD